LNRLIVREAIDYDILENKKDTLITKYKYLNDTIVSIDYWNKKNALTTFKYPSKVLPNANVEEILNGFSKVKFLIKVDSHGNEIERLKFEEGKHTETFITSYKYDTCGNIVRQSRGEIHKSRLEISQGEILEVEYNRY